jgi:tetratricopeptide (TPR) repeat protein
VEHQPGTPGKLELRPVAGLSWLTPETTAAIHLTINGVVMEAAPYPLPLGSIHATPPPPRKSVWTRAKQWLIRFRRIAELAIVGVLLALTGLFFDVRSIFSSAEDQKALLDGQSKMQSQIASVPDETARRVADMIGLDAAVREDGPLKDLAGLAHRSEPIKQEANDHLNSGDAQRIGKGAADLQDFAERKRDAVDRLLPQVASDFREAGAAHLVAKNLSAAFAAYQEAARLDPSNFSGLLTLSDVALASGNNDVAERAARDSLSLAEKEQRNYYMLSNATRQLTQVLTIKGRIDDATALLAPWESRTRKTLQTDQERFERLNAQGASGLVRPDDGMLITKKGFVATYYNGDIVSAYAFAQPDTYGHDAEVMLAETSLVISRYQLLDVLANKEAILRKQGKNQDALQVLDEGIELSRKQVAQVPIPGVEHRLLGFLESRGRFRSGLGDHTRALTDLEEARDIHRRLFARLERMSANGQSSLMMSRRDLLGKAKEHKSSLALLLARIGMERVALGDFAAALSAMRESLKLHTELVADGGDAETRLWLLLNQQHVSAILSKRGETKESCEYARSARILTKELEREPLSTGDRSFLAALREQTTKIDLGKGCDGV